MGVAMRGRGGVTDGAEMNSATPASVCWRCLDEAFFVRLVDCTEESADETGAEESEGGGLSAIAVIDAGFCGETGTEGRAESNLPNL